MDTRSRIVPGIAGLLLVLAGLGFSLQAKEASAVESPLQSSLKAYVVELDSDGEEKLKTVGSVSPGQLIEYRLSYSNAGSQPLSGLQITGPIPPNTEYVDGSASTQVQARLLVSADGGKSFSEPPLIRERRDESGRLIKEAVPPGEYTDIRWLMAEPLRGFDNQTYRYRVRVE